MIIRKQNLDVSQTLIIKYLIILKTLQNKYTNIQIYKYTNIQIYKYTKKLKK